MSARPARMRSWCGLRVSRFMALAKWAASSFSLSYWQAAYGPVVDII